MLHKFNQKKIFLALLVLLLSASLTTLILQKFNKNYSLVKINEKKIEDEKISSEIIEYLKLKNIETDLNKSILEQIYWVERIKGNYFFFTGD